MVQLGPKHSSRTGGVFPIAPWRQVKQWGWCGHSLRYWTYWGCMGTAGKGGWWGCWTHLSRLCEFSFPRPWHQLCSAIAILARCPWTAGPAASPPPTRPERTHPAPTSLVPTTPSSTRQLHRLFWRPTAIPSALMPLRLQYRSRLQLAIAEWPPGDPGFV